jgi:hypothetical protein
MRGTTRREALYGSMQIAQAGRAAPEPEIHRVDP